MTLKMIATFQTTNNFAIITIILIKTRSIDMALIIQDKQVVYVAPPVKLTKNEKKMLENASVNHKLIKKATSRKYKIV